MAVHGNSFGNMTMTSYFSSVGCSIRGNPRHHSCLRISALDKPEGAGCLTKPR